MLNKNNPREAEVKKQDTKSLEENFMNLFQNDISDDMKDKIYISKDIENEELGKFRIDVNIPMLRIQGTECRKINSEITNTFVTKILSIFQTKNIPYTIYNVDFFTAINDNILTLVIKSTLKEGKNAQRVIIKTYNYDLVQEKQLTLSEILEKRGLDEKDVEDKISKKIEEEILKAENIQAEGYSIYKRTINDTMYKIENTTEFMLDKNNNLYIIYPYGNMKITSEVDLVILGE